AGEDRRRHIDGRVVAGEAGPAHLRLRPDRRHQTEYLAVMLDAFADGVDARGAGAHVVADQQPAIDVEPGRPPEVDIGADADRQHDEVGRNLAAVGEQYALGPFAAENLLGLA